MRRRRPSLRETRPSPASAACRLWSSVLAEEVVAELLEFRDAPVNNPGHAGRSGLVVFPVPMGIGFTPLLQDDSGTPESVQGTSVSGAALVQIKQRRVLAVEV